MSEDLKPTRSEILSRNLKRLLESRNLSKADVARAIGETYTTVVSWVNGGRFPRPDKLDILAGYFNVDIVDLILSDEEIAMRFQISDEELKFLKIIRELPSGSKKALLDMTECLWKSNRILQTI